MSAIFQPLYRVIADALYELGVRTVFGVMGEDTAALTVAIAERGIRYLGARHEAVAVAMADGYAWATGRLGVCTVTRGPGLMNAATACRTAVKGARQLLLITGEAPTDRDHRFDYKYVDQRPLASALGLRYLTASEPRAALAALGAAADSARAGDPAVLAIPANVFHAEAEPAAASVRGAASPLRPQPQPPTDEVLAEVVEILKRSERPLLLAGRGAASPRAADAIRELAECTGALLGTTLLAKDLFRGHRFDLGVVGSFASDPAAGLLGDVDCVLAFGASLTPFTTAQRTLFAHAEVVQVDHDPDSIGAAFPVALGVVADAGTTAQCLVERLRTENLSGGSRFHTPETLARLRAPLYGGEDESSLAELDPRVVAATLDRLLPDERVVVLDSGRFMTSPARFIRVPGPDCFRLTADAGSIAVGLGVALGATVARPHVANVLFIGDGGLSMTAGDLETAARHSIPLIAVVMNDCAYGSERVQLERDGLPVSYAALPPINFAKLARALGIEATTVTSLKQLEALAPELHSRHRPLLIDCKIRQDLTVARLLWSNAAIHAPTGAGQGARYDASHRQG